MNSYFARLSSMERRFLAVVGVVVFVVLNLWWVWPHFGDFGRTQKKLAEAQDVLKKFTGETNKIPKLKAQVNSMTSEGEGVQLEEQAGQFARAIEAERSRSGVIIISLPTSTKRETQFFLEQAQTITVASREKQLVDFLYNLGSGNSSVRVRDMSLRPDPPRLQLSATIKLVANYQKNPAARPAPNASAAAPAAAKSPTPTKKSP
jgi:hypothetical protein